MNSVRDGGNSRTLGFDLTDHVESGDHRGRRDHPASRVIDGFRGFATGRVEAALTRGRIVLKRPRYRQIHVLKRLDLPPCTQRGGMKEAVHERDRHHCGNCGRSFATEDLDVDHTVPRGNGGSERFSNLGSLCRRCHDAKHGQGLAPTARFASTGDMSGAEFDWFTHFVKEILPALARQAGSDSTRSSISPAARPGIFPRAICAAWTSSSPSVTTATGPGRPTPTCRARPAPFQWRPGITQSPSPA